jgi:hypothetical protein
MEFGPHPDAMLLYKKFYKKFCTAIAQIYKKSAAFHLRADILMQSRPGCSG